MSSIRHNSTQADAEYAALNHEFGVEHRLYLQCKHDLAEAKALLSALSFKNLSEELVLHGLVDRVALDDPEGYDDGKTAHAIRCLSERMLRPNATSHRDAQGLLRGSGGLTGSATTGGGNDI